MPDEPQVNDLYTRPVDPNGFTPLKDSIRLEVAPIDGTEAVALRDANHPEAGDLRFPLDELRAAGLPI